MARDARQRLGVVGEDLACEALRQRGYGILCRRYRTRLGEIDIVAEDGATLVFIEVKTRTGAGFGGAAAAVGLRKQRQVARMAADFLARNQVGERPCRFDVVAVDLTPAGAQVEIYTHAFQVS